MMALSSTTHRSGTSSVLGGTASDVGDLGVGDNVLVAAISTRSSRSNGHGLASRPRPLRQSRGGRLLATITCRA